jgi:tetratricopeptide (TPR) repeat protein
MNQFRVFSLLFIGILASSSYAQFEKLEVIVSLSRPPCARPCSDQGDIARRAARPTDGTPADADTYLARAVLNFSGGKYRETLNNYNSLIATTPGDPQLYSSRAIVYTKLGNLNLAAADRQTAGELFDRKVEANTSDPAAYMARGLYYGNAGDLQKELAEYERAIELGMDTPQIHYYRGTSYLKFNEYEKALGDLNRMVELNPRLADSYKIRASLYQTLGDTEQAQADMEKYSELIKQR